MSGSPSTPTIKNENVFNGIFSGIDPTDGSITALSPTEGEKIVEQLAGSEYNMFSPEELEGLKEESKAKEEQNRKKYGQDTDRLDDPGQAGWGVIFSGDETRQVSDALQPLIDYRVRQLGIEKKVLEYSGESVADFLAKYGVSQGAGKVKKVPYYLLIAGSPEKIPYRFQYELQSQYAVGRLDFANPAGYSDYVEQLIHYELTGSEMNRRQAVFWAPENRTQDGDLDRATPLSAQYLAQALYDGLDEQAPGFAKQIWRGEVSRQEATKANLLASLSDPQSPALLFTASHGLAYSKPHADQAKLQGALLAQDGCLGRPVSQQEIFAGMDVVSGVNVRGLIHYAFACYGAGTPAESDFSYGKLVPEIAGPPFVADLPQQMLKSGALAFIGHVDRAWGYSFLGDWTSRTKGWVTPVEVFNSAIKKILGGIPVGHALRDQHDRALLLSNSLLEDILRIRTSGAVFTGKKARKWTERNDARAYIVIGDPAAALRVGAQRKAVALGAVPGAWRTEKLDTGVESDKMPQKNSTQNNHPEERLDPGIPVENPDAAKVTIDEEMSFLAPLTVGELARIAGNSGIVKTSQTGNGSPTAIGSNQASDLSDGTEEKASQPSAYQEGEQSASGEGGASFVNKLDEELLAAWGKHIKTGFEQNSQLFKQVLDAFMRPYWMTVTMYRVMFSLGIIAFVAAGVLGVWRGVEYALIFGGLSVAAFLTYFISRPLEALEQNILFITWLGIIYNTYWTRLMYANDPKTIQAELTEISSDVIKELDRLVSRRAQMAKKRPDLHTPVESPDKSPKEI